MTKADLMKLSDLEMRLLAAGCNRNSFAIGARGTADNAHCIANQNGGWEVFYTERGSDSSPVFISKSESDACEFFFKLVSEQDQWHLVGWLQDEGLAAELEKRLSALGINPVRNDIPIKGSEAFRVYVMGKDIFPVLKAVPDVPILDGAPHYVQESRRLHTRYYDVLRSIM